VALFALGLLSASVCLRSACQSLPAYFFTHMLPTRSVISQAAASGNTDSDVWFELTDRELSPAQIERLATFWLDERLGNRPVPDSALYWLYRQIERGTLSEALRRRYYSERYEAWIEVPDTARVGDSFDVALESVHRCGRRFGDRCGWTFFSGFFVGDERAPRARPKDDPTRVYWNAAPEDPAVLAEPTDGGAFAWAGSFPVARVTAERPGPLRIRAVLWFVVAPGDGAAIDGVHWLTDTELHVPPDMLWSERIDLEHTVVVTE
jgi:hypothetical protein